MDHAEKIIDSLERAWRRDMAKGGSGWLDTAEVAERLGVSTATARRRLEALFQADKIDASQDREGGPIMWRALRLHYASSNERERSEAMTDARRAAQYMSTMGEPWAFRWTGDGYTVRPLSQVWEPA